MKEHNIEYRLQNIIINLVPYDSNSDMEYKYKQKHNIHNTTLRCRPQTRNATTTPETRHTENKNISKRDIQTHKMKMLTKT